MTKLPIEKAYAQLEHLHNECEGRYKKLQDENEGLREEIARLTPALEMAVQRLRVYNDSEYADLLIDKAYKK